MKDNFSIFDYQLSSDKMNLLNNISQTNISINERKRYYIFNWFY